MELSANLRPTSSAQGSYVCGSHSGSDVIKCGMPRRSQFAVAAEKWFQTYASGSTILTADLWLALCKYYPDLTASSPTRKTPKATCMRDLRYDDAFQVAAGKITWKGTS